MSYTTHLTTDEKKELCEIISGRLFKKLFIQNENDFSKILKGFRAKSLPETKALNFAIRYIDNPLISSFIDKNVDIYLKQINKDINELEKNGISHHTALATALLDSAFANNISLYFTLTKTTIDENDFSELSQKMECIKSVRIINEREDPQIKVLEEENRSLSEQIEVAQQSSHEIEEKYIQQSLEVEIEKAELSSKLADAQKEITELQTISTSNEINETDYLKTFDDTDVSLLPQINSDNTVSLCSVSYDYSGRMKLIRHADLQHDGRFHIFHKDETTSPYFENRDWIYNNDGPADEDFYGLWTWSTIPNKNDASTDYVISSYNTDIEAIEIVTIKNIFTLDELVYKLKSGISFHPHSNKIIFSFSETKGIFCGVMCHTKDLETSDGIIRLSDDCNMLPVYEISSSDILRIGDALSFYKRAFIGCPSKLFYTKSSLEIVQNIVISSISWTTYKARGFTRNEYTTFREFINALPTSDITHEIEIQCHCPTQTAEKLFAEFLDVAYQYIDGNSLDDKIIISAISASTELQEKAKSLIHADWEAENSNMLSEAQAKLDSLNSALITANTSLTETQKALKNAQSEYKRISDMISEKEKLAEDVEKAVSEKIQKARNDAADFIANMAFVGAQSPTTSVVSNDVAIPSQSIAVPYRSFSSCQDLNELDAHHSWTDVLNTVSIELSAAGVSEHYLNGLAAFLCAAYIEKQPLLLIGPNAADIIQAFTAAVTARKHGELYCEGDYTYQIIEKIGVDDEKIVIINNLIASNWMNRLPEILSQKDIFYIAIHPYAEDVQVEPKSLYSFMLPLFTEFFVDKKATGDFYGGYFADDFKGYSTSRKTSKKSKIVSALAPNLLAEERINSIIATMHDIYPEASTDDDFLYAILPIAYATLSIDKVTEAIADKQEDTTISASLKRNLRYILGEI